MSSYIKNNYTTEEIFWIYEIGDVISELRISRVYNRNALLWEYANSNFYTSDNCIIVTADKFVFNGRRDINN